MRGNIIRYFDMKKIECNQQSTFQNGLLWLEVYVDAMLQGWVIVVDYLVLSLSDDSEKKSDYGACHGGKT